jgi:hypothetical protein
MCETLKWYVADQLQTGKAYIGNRLGLIELEPRYFVGEFNEQDWNPLPGQPVTQRRFELRTL